MPDPSGNHHAARPQGQQHEAGDDGAVRIAGGVDERSGVVALLVSELRDVEMEQLEPHAGTEANRLFGWMLEVVAEEAEVAGLVAHLVDHHRGPYGETDCEADQNPFHEPTALR